MNPIALQTALIPEGTLDEKLAAAAAAGADGIELPANASIYTDIPAIIDASDRYGVKIAALRLGHTRLIDPNYAERERALVAIQDALTAAVDLGAQGVVFYGHYAPHHVLPDLEPYKAAVELEAELLITLLRKTICDLADALGMQLFLEHADSGTSALLRRPEHAALIRARLDNHPRLMVALNHRHLDAEGIGPQDALTAAGIGYLTVCDSGGRLPGTGRRDWAAWLAGLRSVDYRGWVTIEGNAPAGPAQLAESIRALRTAGY